MFSFAEMASFDVIHFSHVVVGCAPFSQNWVTPIVNVLMLSAPCCVVSDSGQKISCQESIQTVFHYSVWQKALCFILATLA